MNPKDLFGEFRPEFLVDNEYIIVCDLGVFGQSMNKSMAEWLANWLNAAMEKIKL